MRKRRERGSEEGKRKELDKGYLVTEKGKTENNIRRQIK